MTLSYLGSRNVDKTARTVVVKVRKVVKPRQ